MSNSYPEIKIKGLVRTKKRDLGGNI